MGVWQQEAVQADLGHRKSKCGGNVSHRQNVLGCVCLCEPSVLTRLLDSDKKSDWTRLENEYRAGEKTETRKVTQTKDDGEQRQRS